MRWVFFILMLSALAATAGMPPAKLFPILNKPASGGGGGGGITIVSTNSNHTTAESTSISCNISGTVLANDTIIVFVGDANVINTPSGYTQGNTFPDDCEGKIFWKNAAGGETSVAVTTSTGHGVIFVLVARGLKTSAVVDKTSTSSNQSDPLSCGTTAATAQADELIIAACTYPAPGGTPTLVAGPAGYTTVGGEVSTGSAGSFGLVAGHFAYLIVSATGTQTASFDLSSATPSGNSGSGGITTFMKQ